METVPTHARSSHPEREPTAPADRPGAAPDEGGGGDQPAATQVRGPATASLLRRDDAGGPLDLPAAADAAGPDAAGQLLQLQARLRAAEHLGDLLAHELRNVVIVLQAHAGLLAHEWDRLAEPDRRRSMDTIEQESTHLGDLLTSLLELTSGRRRPARRVAVAALVRDIVAHDLNVGDVLFDPFDPGGERPDPEAVLVDIDDDLWAATDPDLLEVVVRNLVGNALRHGEPPVVVGAGVHQGGLELRVADHGHGVDPAFVPHLFERFRRAATSGPGLGLGLAIVHDLVERDGGTVHHEPTPSGGATFVVRLPHPAEHQGHR